MGAQVDLMSSGDVAIGEVSARFGVAPHVLRHWEDVGLLAPRRADDGRRRYDDGELVRVAMIQQGKELGFSLDAIRTFLDRTADPDVRRDLLRRHHEALERRIRAAQEAQRTIEGALECTRHDFLDCPEFHRAMLERVPPG